jgi:O-antigen ligase
VTRSDLRLLWPLAVALALAAVWPLTAQAVHPAVVPALLAAAATVALVARRPDQGIALVLLLAPFTNAALAGGRPVRYVVSGLVVALFAYGLLLWRDARGRTPGWLSALVIGFVAAATLSSLFAIDPGKSVTRFSGVVVAAVLFFAVIQICRTRAQLVVVAGGAVGSLLIAGGQGVVQKLTGHTSYAGVVIDDQVVGRVAGSFSHPNQFAAYLIILIPVVATLVLTRGAIARGRGWAGLAVALGVAALAFSFTRGAILGLVGGVLVWLAFVRPRSALIVAVVIAVGGVTLAPAALKERLSEPTGGDLGLRADLWRSALDIYRESPVVGAGLGNFSEGYSRLPAQLSSGAQRRLLHQQQILVPPHANNLFLTILAEEGIIGALAFLGLMGAALAICRRAALRADPLTRALGIGLGAGLCAMLVHSLLEYTLFGEMSFVVFALLGVVAVLVDQTADSAAPERAERSAARTRPGPI